LINGSIQFFSTIYATLSSKSRQEV